LFEALLRGPDWLGPALIAFAVLLVALGRFGQRLLMAAVFGGAFYWAALQLKFGNGGKGSSAALITAGCGAALGALLPAWTLAVAAILAPIALHREARKRRRKLGRDQSGESLREDAERAADEARRASQKA